MWIQRCRGAAYRSNNRKMHFGRFKKQILTTGDSFSLENIIREVNTLETINRQFGDFAEKKN